MQVDREDAFNVMVLTLLIIVVVVIFSLVALQAITHDSYLNSYFILESLFSVTNTAASTELATLAFSLEPTELVPILLVVVVDNLSRILIVSFIIAAVIDFLNYANIENAINNLKSRRLRNHAILCGYNDIAERLMDQLKERHKQFIVVEPRREICMELNDRSIVNINDEFSKEEALLRAGIARAHVIVFTSESNVNNVIGSIVARRLNPRIKVLSRLGEESIRKKVYGIGTDMAVIPEHLAGIEMGEYIIRAGA